ncbi:MAG: AbrB/MazE/SpoVT family DNA-binding domain-containing protein [Peptococcaceae bacterium]|jgi:AbrB family looped-hinge helix DNA binding protein|nr:AbrB/MazE/SpoVT family DNA-binding domain-containing protein [Peptococcaceae bacterium]
MLAGLRQKSQITIPKEIVAKLGLHEGDKLEFTERDGVILLMPVVVYPKKYVPELRGEIEDAKAKIASGEQLVFESVDALFAKLEENEWPVSLPLRSGFRSIIRR